MALPLGPNKIDSGDIWGEGKCDRCGAEGVPLHCICDDEKVCAECLNTYYFECDNCGQCWEDDVMEMREGRCLCPDCADEYDSEQEEGDDKFTCEGCGEDFDEDDLVEFNGELYCEKCIDQARIDAMSSGDIWFTGGGWSRCTYMIQGDGPQCSAAFGDFDAADAFLMWCEHCVDLEKELDATYKFFMRRGTLRKGPVLCLYDDDNPQDWVEDLSDEDAELMSRGEAPKGWVKVDAKKAQKYIDFEYVG